MGGHIWVESELGRGSTFHFTVRCGRSREPRADPVLLIPVALRGVPVLIVDDNRTNRELLRAIVSSWGMNPTLASSGREALVAAEAAARAEAPFSLMLLDGSMPEMDGFTVAENLRRHPALSGATIMLLTSAGQARDLARCRDLGISVYLTKPVTPSELFDAVMRVLATPAAKASAAPLLTRQVLRESRRRLRVLVVEDNPVNQTLTSRMLEKLGHAARVVANGAEAVVAAGGPGLDLLLMDIEMPEMDGLQATAAIRAREEQTGGHLPIIALTAHAMAGDRERFLAAGMDGYLSKPLRRDDLASEISRVLSTRGAIDPPSGPGPAPPLDDPPVRVSLALRRADGDRDLLEELVRTFQEDLSQRTDLLQAAIRRGDHEETTRSAHSLRGSLGILGAERAQALAQELEALGAAGRLGEAATVCRTFEEEVARVTAFFSSSDWKSHP